MIDLENITIIPERDVYRLVMRYMLGVNGEPIL